MCVKAADKGTGIPVHVHCGMPSNNQKVTVFNFFEMICEMASTNCNAIYSWYNWWDKVNGIMIKMFLSLTHIIPSKDSTTVSVATVDGISKLPTKEWCNNQIEQMYNGYQVQQLYLTFATGQVFLIFGTNTITSFAFVILQLILVEIVMFFITWQDCSWKTAHWSRKNPEEQGSPINGLQCHEITANSPTLQLESLTVKAAIHVKAAHQMQHFANNKMAKAVTNTENGALWLEQHDTMLLTTAKIWSYLILVSHNLGKLSTWALAVFSALALLIPVKWVTRY